MSIDVQTENYDNGEVKLESNLWKKTAYFFSLHNFNFYSIPFKAILKKIICKSLYQVCMLF